MSTRKAQHQGSGFGALVGIALLFLTVAWPFLVFHRHWTTTSLFNCATNYADALIATSGCTYDWNTGAYSGTGTLTTTHSAISATGWIVGVIWVAFLAVVAGLFYRLHEKQQHQRAATEAARVVHREVLGVMSPREFEEALAALCRRDGCHSVKVTGKAGDLGADVVAVTPDGRRLVIQAKRYGLKTLVSGPDIQKFAGTARALHHADVAVVVTTSGFTRQAREIAPQLGILLFDETKLAGWASSIGPSPWQARTGASFTKSTLDTQATSQIL